MSAPFKQTVIDHDQWSREPEVAHPDAWLIDEDWRWVGFEFAGGVR